MRLKLILESEETPKETQNTSDVAFLDRLELNKDPKWIQYFYDKARNATNAWDEYYYTMMALLGNKKLASEETQKYFRKNLRFGESSVDISGVGVTDNKTSKHHSTGLDDEAGDGSSKDLYNLDPDEYGRMSIDAYELKPYDIRQIIEFMEKSTAHRAVASNILRNANIDDIEIEAPGLMMSEKMAGMVAMNTVRNKWYAIISEFKQLLRDLFI